MSDNVTTILEIFEAIETRDAEAFARRCQPDVTEQIRSYCERAGVR